MLTTALIATLLDLRFDRMLYLGVSDTHDAQLDILQALTRKFRLHEFLNLKLVAERCSFNYTGADFYALCSDAMLNAMSRKAEELEEKIGGLTDHQSLSIRLIINSCSERWNPTTWSPISAHSAVLFSGDGIF